MRRTISRIAASLAVFLVASAVADERPEPVTGTRLREALGTTVPAVTWSNVPYRQAWRRLADEYRLAVLLDRRIDPSREITFEATNLTVRQLAERLAAEGKAEVRVVGNVVYVGPPEAATKLRTLVVLRTGEFTKRSPGTELPASTVRWADLDSPSAVLVNVTGRLRTRVANADRIPHDLWAAGVLPNATIVESLSLLLVQFGLTFEWIDAKGGADTLAVRLVPIPESVGLERLHDPKRVAVTEAVRDWPRRFPNLTATAAGRRVRVVGTIEQHEAIAALARGDAVAGRDPKPMQPDQPGLDRRRFTLTIKQVPVIALMKKLEESGVRFDYDADSLAKAGIDLATRIDIDVNDATAEAFFTTMFGPLKADFTIDGLTVRLSPRRE